MSTREPLVLGIEPVMRPVSALCAVHSCSATPSSLYGGARALRWRNPEIASALTLDAMIPALKRHLRSGHHLDQVDAIAVTAGPGLVGAHGGCLTAKASANASKPLYGLNLVPVGVGLLEDNGTRGWLRITVECVPWSGCTTGLAVSKSLQVREALPPMCVLGATLDDAARRGLRQMPTARPGLPGRPAIDRAAAGYRNTVFPRGLSDRSSWKTAEEPGALSPSRPETPWRD